MSDSPLPPENGVGRVALWVAALDSVLDFYESVVGLVVRERRPDRATLGTDDAPLVELVASPDRPERPETAAGLFHAAVRVPSRAALGATLARIEDGWHLSGASDHGVSEALYLRDPAGNGVEVYRDRPRADWPTVGDRVSMDTRPLDLYTLRAAADDASGRVPPETDVGHVHLEVTSLENSREFYGDELGLGVRQAWGDDALFLAAGDYHHHVGLNTWNRRSTAASGRGLAWFELFVPGDALAGVRERVASERISTLDSHEGIEVEDPDGIRVRLQSV